MNDQLRGDIQQATDFARCSCRCRGFDKLQGRLTLCIHMFLEHAHLGRFQLHLL